MHVHVASSAPSFGVNNVTNLPGARIRVVQRIKSMQAFDRLPWRVRDAIAYAKFTFSPQDAEDLLTKYGLSPKEVAEFVKEMDDAYLKKVLAAEAKETKQ